MIEATLPLLSIAAAFFGPERRQFRFVSNNWNAGGRALHALCLHVAKSRRNIKDLDKAAERQMVSDRRAGCSVQVPGIWSTVKMSEIT